MSFQALARIRIKKDVVVRIHRKLSGKGTIRLSIGQEVTPEDLIGVSSISSGFRILKLAELLSVAPNEVEKYLKRALGKRIYKGELLAERSGKLFGGKKIVTAPTDGVLDLLNPKSGELRITFFPKQEDLPAAVYGIVEHIDQAKGEVVIRTQVSLVYGLFGSGRVRDGILRIIGKRDDLIGKSSISQKFEGQILAGGCLVLKDAISSGISAGVSGIITGGINARDYRSLAGGRLIFPKKLDNDIGVSIVAAEGFGPVPMGEDIDKILKIYEGRFVLIDGNAGVISLPSFEADSIIKVRKTHLPPIQIENSKHELELKIGLRVRVAGNTFVGEQGVIVALDKTETTLPSGVKAYLATIETRRRKIQAPVANLEIMDYIHKL